MRRIQVVVSVCAAAALLLHYQPIEASALQSDAQASAEKAVQSAVEDFLTRLGDARYDTLETDFTPNALIVVARQREGSWTNAYQTAEEWLGALRKNPKPTRFREPISNVKVTIDSGELAYLRADFQVVVEGKVRSSGVDQFTLVRDNGRWKIAAIAYTSIPER